MIVNNSFFQKKLYGGYPCYYWSIKDHEWLPAIKFDDGFWYGYPSNTQYDYIKSPYLVKYDKHDVFAHFDIFNINTSLYASFCYTCTIKPFSEWLNRHGHINKNGKQLIKLYNSIVGF